jgi:hypothetical protein
LKISLSIADEYKLQTDGILKLSHSSEAVEQISPQEIRAMYDEFLKFKKALEKEIDDFRIRKSNLQDWVERTVSANARTLQNEDVYTLQHNVRDINNELIRMQDGVDRRFVDFQEKLEEISDWTLSIRALAASFNQRSPDLSPVNAYQHLVTYLNSIAEGCNEAKEEIAFCIVNHLQRRAYPFFNAETKDLPLLVVGEPGTGKTYLVKEAVKKANFPLFYIDLEQIVAQGNFFIGLKNEIATLEKKHANEFAVVFLDNIDVISSIQTNGFPGLKAQKEVFSFLKKIIDSKKEGGMSEQFGERFSFIQIESADFESFSKWLRDPKQPFQLSIKSLKDDRSVDFIMDEGLLDQLALRLSKKTSHFRSAKECITRAFFKIIRSRILKRNIVEDFKDVDGVEVIQTPDNRIRVTVKSIDFFVKEEKAKTSEEVVLDAMKGRAYREKVEEEAKGLQARKEAEDLVRRLEPVESQLRRRTEEAEIELQARKDAEDVVKKREPVESQLRRRTEDAQIELQARKNAELNVGWWGPRLWGGAGTLILYLSQEALRKLMK